MAFGKIKNVNVTFNGQCIEQVNQYKYLGNIVESVSRFNCDPFKANSEYLCDKARKAIYAMSYRTKFLNPVPPLLKFYLFSSLILPILSYGSEVWAISKASLDNIDKVFLKFIRSSISVKSTTSNIIMMGESGQFPPSVSCVISLLKYTNRLHNLAQTMLVKQVYDELVRLNGLGFQTWVGKVTALATQFDLKIGTSIKEFSLTCGNSIRSHYVRK